MNHVPSPSFDDCFFKLMREEQCRHSQTIVDQHHLPIGVKEVAFVAKGTLGHKDPQTIQCYSCKDYGHIAKECKKQLCNYYNKGYIIINFHRHS